jgi:inorganic phosphate transporter, PiT family
MDILVLFFITSGIFLGWSLGANHAVNVFGTAVISKMVKFRVAAFIAGAFVILGSVIGGAGATKTLNDLGSINALAGSFTVALSVAISVTWMTRIKLPVSTSQAVVGAIIGWNIFTGSPTDMSSLYKILLTWVISPLLAALFGYVLFILVEKFLKKVKIHMLELDAYTRVGLIVVGAMASYALGANNIANVMGLFVSAQPFREIQSSIINISGMQQLFFIGGMAIAIGIYTYGYNVMVTVGTNLYKITPISGLVVVLAESIVLFLFSSQELEHLLTILGLPTLPLVPLSSTQAVIGAVIGVGLAKGGQGINYKVLGKISAGWVIAPIVAGIITFIALFFVQNVFEQKVINSLDYEVNLSVIKKLNEEGINTDPLKLLSGKRFSNSRQFKNELQKHSKFSEHELFVIFNYSTVDSLKIDTNKIISEKEKSGFSTREIEILKPMQGKIFIHHFIFADWIMQEYSKNGIITEPKEIETKTAFLINLFKIDNHQPNKKE